MQDQVPVDMGEKWTPHERLSGETPDISEWIDLPFMIGYGIGIFLVKKTHQIEAEMCYYILIPKSQVISWSTVQHIAKDELLLDCIMTWVEVVDKKISR